jgi:hypothetical protein
MTASFFAAGASAADTAAASQKPAAAPHTGEGRIIHVWDGITMWGTILNSNREPSGDAAQFSKRILEEMVDEEAAAHVDAIAYCLFTAFYSDLPSSKITVPFGRPPGMDEAGIDFLKVLIERCHQRDMQFIADIRMNDRHGTPASGIMKNHPEWALFDGAWDYAFDGVRQAMLDFTKEVLDGYDVDGIEYDYMRWCHMFKPGEGAKNAHLLTDFTRKTRKLLDDAAKRRGSERLLLGVRVPQILEECDYLGFDLATWISEGLVDFVVPSEFMHTDTNMKTEDFVKLCEGTDCKVYPAIHNRFAMDKPNEHYRLMNLANFRAAAQNFYAFGADGISPYNYQFAFERRGWAHRSSAYSAIMWPAALGWLADLRDPSDIAEHDRHYLFYSLYTKGWQTPSGYPNDENIYLDRGKGVLEGDRRFRMAEDMSDPRLRVTLQFKTLGMADGEKLEIRINGVEVPDDYITCVFDKDGQNVYEGNPLPPFHEYTIDMNWESTGRKQPIVFGDNDLTVRLAPSPDKKDGEVSIEELECYVYVRKSPLLPVGNRG